MKEKLTDAEKLARAHDAAKRYRATHKRTERERRQRWYEAHREEINARRRQARAEAKLNKAQPD